MTNVTCTTHPLTHGLLAFDGADMLNSMGDLEDLNGVLADAEPSLAARVPIPNAVKDTDCSGFIKVLPGNADIVVGHSTWRDFYQMIRVYKVRAEAPLLTCVMNECATVTRPPHKPATHNRCITLATRLPKLCPCRPAPGSCTPRTTLYVLVPAVPACPA